MRLKETEGLYEIVKKSIYELPIKVSFMLEQEDNFNDKIISYVRKIQETASWLKERMTTSPKTAIILGTGLGQLASEITGGYEFPYSEIPNFPVSTAQGHAGKLIFGKLGGKDIMAMEGRFHYYEGYDMKAVTFPERVMYELGIETLFVSNASGGMNPEFQIGDLMIIDDASTSSQNIHCAERTSLPVHVSRICTKHTTRNSATLPTISLRRRELMQSMAYMLAFRDLPSRHRQSIVCIVYWVVTL